MAPCLMAGWRSVAHRLEVLLVGLELIDALEVVVAADDVEGHAEAVEVVAHQLEALRRARVELFGFGAVLGLAQIAERHEEVGVRRFHVLPPLQEVLRVARVHVEVAEDGDGVPGMGCDVQ